MFLGKSCQLLQELREEGSCKCSIPHVCRKAGMSQAFLSFLYQERLEYRWVSFREVLSFPCVAAVLDIT